MRSAGITDAARHAGGIALIAGWIAVAALGSWAVARPSARIDVVFTASCSIAIMAAGIRASRRIRRDQQKIVNDLKFAFGGSSSDGAAETTGPPRKHGHLRAVETPHGERRKTSA